MRLPFLIFERLKIKNGKNCIHKSFGLRIRNIHAKIMTKLMKVFGCNQEIDRQTKCQILDLCRALNLKPRLRFARSTTDDDMHTPCPHTVVLIKCGNFTQQINLVGTFFSFNWPVYTERQLAKQLLIVIITSYILPWKFQCLLIVIRH